MIKYKRWIKAIWLFLFILIFISNEPASAQSSTNYKIKKSIIDQGGGRSNSTNYKLVDAVGLSTAIGVSNSTNYKISSGFFFGGGAIENPVLAVSPTTLDFGTTHNSLSFQISNVGSGNLEWTVQENPDKPWITSINPDRGTNNATVTVTVDHTKLIGNSDTGTLVVNSNGGTQNVTVKIGEDGGVPIYPVATSPQSPGTEFWVDIKVGTNSKPVTNLFGVTFNLNFTHTQYIDVVTPYISNVIPGDFLGSDVVLVQNVDEYSSKVSIGIAKKSGQSGSNGYGCVAKVKFIAQSYTPDNTLVQFLISDGSASDPSGNSIPLDAGTLTVTIMSGLLVWPGDTNHDKFVNQADVLPIGLHWGKTGPARPNASMTWIGQPAPPWNPVNATYADANGDGIVNQGDVLPIGLNWGKSHTGLFVEKVTNSSLNASATDSAIIMLKYNGSTNPGQHFFIDVIVKNVTDLFGLSYELFYIPTSFIDSLTVEEGPNNILGNDLIFFPVVDEKAGLDTGKVSVGISRKFGQGGITADSGLVTRIEADMTTGSVIDESTTILWFKNLLANDPNGNTIPFKVDTTSLKLVTYVEKKTKDELPTEFVLHQNYPNPFNPETRISYDVVKPTRVRLRIINLQGRQIRTLINEEKPAGFHEVTWDGKDDHGQRVASGVYLYRLESKDFMQTRKMILLQ